MGHENKPTVGKAVACLVAAFVWSMPLWQSIAHWKFGWWDLLPLSFTLGFGILGIVILVKYFKQKNK